MARVSRFNEFLNEDINGFEPDEDNVGELLKNHGWGDDVVSSWRDDFEESPYYKNPQSDEEYANQFHEFMYNHSQWGNLSGEELDNVASDIISKYEKNRKPFSGIGKRDKARKRYRGIFNPFAK